MKTQVYRSGGCAIEVLFHDGSVHVVNNKDLWALLSTGIETGTTALVAWIRQRYRHFFDKELDIAEDSLIVEIWGHVYYEYYMLAIKELIRLNLVNDLLERMLKVTEIIDCGEQGKDNNRKLWDLLAPHKSFILKMLPGKIEPGQLKEES